VETSLDRLWREQGLLDGVGLFREARKGAASWSRRLGLTRAEVHGATELVGSQGDLLEALAEVVPVRLYQPDPGDPHGEQIRVRWPWSFEVTPIPATSYPRPSRDRAEPGEAIRVMPVPGGPLEELERVAGEVLRRLDEGREPGEISIVARTLEPYASWLPVVFERYGIPYSSSLSESALLHSDGRSVLHLARALLADLEREAVVELVRSSAFRSEPGPTNGMENHGLANLVERLARAAGITHGRDPWTGALERADDLLQEDGIRPSTEELQRLEKIIDGLARDAAGVRQAATWKGAIGAIQGAVDRWIPTFHAEPQAAARAMGLLAREATRSALQGLESCDAVDEATRHTSTLTPGALRDSIEEALGRASIRPYAEDRGGVLVLDAIQARGVEFQHLFLIGVNEAFWPRTLDEDPFLPDAVRLQLREQLHRPVPIRGEAETEERFLFRLIGSQARASLTASFHRIDPSGGEAAPSPYLRPLLDRVPEAKALKREIYTPDPTAPAAALPGPADLVPFRSALVEATLREGADTLEALAEYAQPDDAEILRRGLDYMAAVEEFESADLRFDGIVEPGPTPAGETFRPTRLETLARCPLRAFFSNILRVPEFVEHSSTELEARELGSLIHEALRHVYGKLYESGRLHSGGASTEAVDAAKAELDRILDEGGAVRLRIERTYPGLRAGLRRQVRRALDEFLEWDLEGILRDGVVRLSCEDEFDQELELAADRIPVRGKIDRWVELPAGRFRISDYKTGATPEDSVKEKEIKAGRALQIPLYALAVAQEREATQIEAEVLHVPLRPERLRGRRAERTHRLTQSSLEEIRAEIEHPAITLVGLLRSGRFPFRRSDGCDHCPYSIACRRTHPATRARVRQAEEFRAYHEMAGTQR
jgi:RecB family exonuclease